MDMGAKTCPMHIIRIDSEEIPRFATQFQCHSVFSWSDDDLVDILLFGMTKSMQREMDCQGFDHLTHAPVDAAAFMEHIEMPEDFDANKKTTEVAANKGKKKKNSKKESCDTSECKTLMAKLRS